MHPSTAYVSHDLAVVMYQGAEWDPEGRFILISFSNSTTLGSIHFASRPPSLGNKVDFSLLVIANYKP